MADSLIYLVVGEEGEYEGYHKWCLDAFTTLAAAEKRADDLHTLRAEFKRAEELCGLLDAPEEWLTAYRKRADDPNFCATASYGVEAIRLR